MRIIAVLIAFTLSIYSQSSRIGPNSKKESQLESPKEEKTVKQILGELREQIDQNLRSLYVKNSQKEFEDVVKRNREIATKAAEIAQAKQNKSAEDWFYLGKIYLIAENPDAAKASFEKFLSQPESKALINEKRKAYIILSTIATAKDEIEEAENWLSKYLENPGDNQFEEITARFALIEKYTKVKNYQKALDHAERAYALTKDFLSVPEARQTAIDALISLNDLFSEAYTKIGKPEKAIEKFDDLRQFAASIESALIYLTAVDRKIRYLIENGKKNEALSFFRETLKNINSDFKTKAVQDEVTSRLKRKERQYEILGEKALEIDRIDHWLPESVAKKLSSLQGKVVLIHFWATWCSFCISQIPQLNEWAQNYQKDGLEIIGLTRYYNSVEGKNASNEAELDFISKFKEKFKIQYPIAVAKDAINHHNYSVQALPTTVLIDRNGIVRYIESGAGTIREIEISQMLKKLLLEK